MRDDYREVMLVASMREQHMYPQFKCMSIRSHNFDGLTIRYFGVSPTLWVEAQENEHTAKRLHDVTQMLMVGRTRIECHA